MIKLLVFATSVLEYLFEESLKRLIASIITFAEPETEPPTDNLSDTWVFNEASKLISTVLIRLNEVVARVCVSRAFVVKSKRPPLPVNVPIDKALSVPRCIVPLLRFNAL